MRYLIDHSKSMLSVWETAAILNFPLTPAGNMRRPFEALLGQWIETDWMDISPELDDMNGAETDALWESDQEEYSFSSDQSVGSNQ